MSSPATKTNSRKRQKTSSNASSTGAEKESTDETNTTSNRSLVPAQHITSVAGSVISAPVATGGNLLIRIQNMSSTANLGVALDLKQIALKCRNTEYNPRRFAAVIMRLRDPRATALLFASGKMCVTGVKSTHNARLAVQKFAVVVGKLGFTTQKEVDFKVQNIVGTSDLGFPIRLEGLVYAHSNFASYEPELFPGLIYRFLNPKVVFLIFVSGKIVITGAKKETDLSTALTKLYPVLLEFRKSQVAPLPALPDAAAEKVDEAVEDTGLASGDEDNEQAQIAMEEV